MKSRLINVRLDAERLRKAARLRDKGITLSDVVREAIDVRYGDLTAPDTRASAADIVSSILDRFPDPPDLPARAYDVHDARTARLAVRKRLGRSQAGSETSDKAVSAKTGRSRR